MKKPGGGSAQLTTVSKKIGTEWGREVKMLGENFAPDMLAPNTVYSRFSQFAKSQGPIYTVLAIDRQGQVALLRSNLPRSRPEIASSTTKTRPSCRSHSTGIGSSTTVDATSIRTRTPTAKQSVTRLRSHS